MRTKKAQEEIPVPFRVGQVVYLKERRMCSIHPRFYNVYGVVIWASKRSLKIHPEEAKWIGGGKEHRYQVAFRLRCCGKIKTTLVFHRMLSACPKKKLKPICPKCLRKLGKDGQIHGDCTHL